MTQYDAIPLADVLKSHIRGERIAQMTVASHSMSPLLNRGDVIGLQQIDPAAVRPGQIITFRDPNNPDGLLTHRVAAVYQEDQDTPVVLTRGDRMLVFDRPLKADDLVGHVMWRVRDGRKLLLDEGSGAWLSRRLGTISKIERRLISGEPFEALRLTPEGLADANARIISRRASSYARSVRAIGRSGSRVLAAIIK